ncbi:MAG: AAA family ATPase [Candidatus Hodarchaeales archaeon]
MSKFYGECVAEDSLVLTNGNGLKSIGETIREGEVHSIAGLNFDTGEINLLPVKELFDKGMQRTIRIKTPHGQLEVTPSSKLLILNNGKLDWIYADELELGDQIASPRTLKVKNTEIPLILNSLKDKTLIKGDIVKRLFSNMSEYGKSAEYAKELGVTQRKFESLKYSKGKIPALYVKKLFSLYPLTDQYDLYLEHDRKIPLHMTEDLMYILGVLAGDGHLRYSHSHGTVSQIILTVKDEAVKERYFKAIKKTFNITPQKYSDSYSYYFNSRPLGDLLHNLGLPYSKKSETITVPHYAITTPINLLKAYLQGLFDSDGGIQYITEKNSEKLSIQVNYTSKSRKLVQGIKLCLLRFDILSTISYKKRDETWRLFISDISSLENFKQHISFTHKTKLEKINSVTNREYSRPTYDRIPIAEWIYDLAKEVNVGHRELLRNGINPAVKGLTIEQVLTAYDILKEKGLDDSLLSQINYVLDLNVIWSPIRKIASSKAHVFDFEVPKHHNFIANGIIVHNSEARLREIFKEAEDNAPSIIFIDEIDAIAPKREEVSGEVERRVVAQILALMDGLESRGETIVIGATNRPNALDPALRRPGRFDREIEIGVPDQNERLEILQIHTRRMPGIENVDRENLALITHGFVGADLAALGREAAMKKLREILPDINLTDDTIPPAVLDNLKVEDRHFEDALKEIHPSAIREVFIEIPNVKWTDIGGMDTIKQELIEIVEWPLKHKDSFARLGINPPRAVLLFGAPGTGKTLLAKALATESKINFISVKGPELLSKWVGESEKAIREVFRKARTASPALVFFDEIDAVAAHRGSGDSSGVNERVISQLLTELAGIEPLRDVVILAATNRPDMIDPALLRPGRFDRVVQVPPPDEKSRKLILDIHTRTMPLADDVDLNRIAKETEFYVGADIEAICREAGMLALREGLDTNIVEWRHFEKALSRVHPSCTQEMIKWYETQESQFRRRIGIDSHQTIPLFG